MVLNVFKKYNEEVWEYDRPLIESYKPVLVHKNYESLLDIGLKIMAYDFAIRMQARHDYLTRNFEVSSMEGYGRSEDASSSSETIFESSILDERINERFKAMLTGIELFRAKLPGFDDGVNKQTGEEESEEKSFEEEFENDFLPQYDEERKKLAQFLMRKYKLNRKGLNRLFIMAFEGIGRIANKRHAQSKGSSVGGVVQFLEECIEIYFPIFLKDLGTFTPDKSRLLSMRKKSSGHFNTVCHKCSKPLKKNNNKHYCSQKENRSCYEARRKDVQNPEFPRRVLLRTKNRCDNCGEKASLNYIHHHIKIEEWQFCGKRCYEAFRKRIWRIKPRNNN